MPVRDLDTGEPQPFTCGPLPISVGLHNLKTGNMSLRRRGHHAFNAVAAWGYGPEQKTSRDDRFKHGFRLRQLLWAAIVASLRFQLPLGRRH